MTDKTFAELLERAKAYRMTAEEQRAQAISFAVGNLMIDRPHYDEWMCRLWAAKAYDAKEDR